MSITKAVFPVGGLGTRFLPATKAMPKEMLTLVDKPLIQYCIEEAKQAGITDVIFVTGRGKRAIEDHFDISFELEHILSSKGKKKMRDELRKIHELANFSYVRQGEPLGLGHAILSARNLVGNEPFAVILGDDIIQSKVPCLKQMVKVFEKHGGPVIATQKISGQAIKDYGVIKHRKIDDRVSQIVDLVEKPEPSPGAVGHGRHRALHPHAGNLPLPGGHQARQRRGDPTHRRPEAHGSRLSPLRVSLRGHPLRRGQQARFSEGHRGVCPGRSRSGR